MKLHVKIDDFGDARSEFDDKRALYLRFKGKFCYTSIWRCLAVLLSIVTVLTLVVACKSYVRVVLLWLENQDGLVISTTVCILFVIVSLPISVGYIFLVVASGYLFGVRCGLILVIIGANFGILVAHNLLKIIGHHNSIQRFVQSDLAKVIIRVISGPLSFKIIFCARLTPIPFGLQNTIFALSNLNGKLYHTASLLGLFPAQLIGVYVGSTLRSMQDVLENRNISSMTYVFVMAQIILGAGLLIWFGAKARKELLRALSDAENKYDNTAHSIV